MAIVESVGRLGATLVAMVQTRLELAAVELEEESLRLMGFLMLSLLALFLLGIAVVMVTLFVILFFWDTHRFEAVLGMAALFGVLAAITARKVRAGMAAKPRLLQFTLGELNKDIEFVKNATARHD